MNIKVNTSQNPAHRGAEKLQSLLEAAKDQSVLLMLSGGSAFELLNSIDISIGLEHLTISVLDERYSSDESINNFAQLVKTEFYKKAKAAGASFIDMHIVEGESLNDAEIRFDYALKSWIKDNPGGSVIATMGIGEDGHTAGIFPHSDTEKFRYLFEQDDKFIVGYHAHTASVCPERLTVTNHFLREHVDYAVAYAVGENKRTALESVVRETGELAKTPARILGEMKDAILFTDLRM